jgi:hypothetical protein
MVQVLTVTDIQRELAHRRAELRRNVRSLGEDVRTMTDWRHHFRTHCWWWCSGAMLLGFALVPRGKRMIRSESSRTISGVGPAAVDTHVLGPLLQSALRFAASTAIKETAKYLSHRFQNDSTAER